MHAETKDVAGSYVQHDDSDSEDANRGEPGHNYLKTVKVPFEARRDGLDATNLKC